MDDLKNIVATFVKKDAAEINNDTLINKKVISGSILLHRMYGAINNAGYAIKEYNDINTFGELLSRLNGSVPVAAKNEASVQFNNQNIRTTPASVGVDMEAIANFPLVTDFREDNFYKLNFSMQEISYCVLKEYPTESFAGLFSAKEAICKANEQVRKVPFNQIEIKHDRNGKPQYPGYSISISHSGQFAVAIAIANHMEKTPVPEDQDIMSLTEKMVSLRKWVAIFGIIALVTAAVSITLLLR